MMLSRLFLLLCFGGGALFGASSREIQEIRLNLNHIDYQLHSHQSEIDLFQDRIQTLEREIEALRRPQQNTSVERRLSNLESAHETLIKDFKTLKNHLNETSSSVAQCQSHLTKIDKQLTSDIKSLKGSLQSMVSLLQQGGGDALYTVKPGDSLGQIALDHKVDLKTLKKLNNLENDTIFVGQKLHIPN